MSGKAWLCGIALAASLAVLPAGSAGAADWLEMMFGLSGPRFDGVVPTCDAPWVLGKVASRFNQKENAFWNSDLVIVSIDAVRQTAFRPGPPNTIPRRYCSGIALVSDGVTRPVHYSIIEDSGIIGAVWGVEWCVEGLDRNMAYSPRCKMARP